MMNCCVKGEAEANSSLFTLHSSLSKLWEEHLNIVKLQS